MYGDSGLREGVYSRGRAVWMGKEISRGAEELSLCPSVKEPTCLSFVVLATAQRQKDKAALNVALLQLIQTWNGKKSICNLCMYTNKAGCQESRFTSQKAFCRTLTKKWQKNPSSQSTGSRTRPTKLPISSECLVLATNSIHLHQTWLCLVISQMFTSVCEHQSTSKGILATVCSLAREGQLFSIVQT